MTRWLSPLLFGSGLGYALAVLLDAWMPAWQIGERHELMGLGGVESTVARAALGIACAVLGLFAGPADPGRGPGRLNETTGKLLALLVGVGFAIGTIYWPWTDAEAGAATAAEAGADSGVPPAPAKPGR